MMTDSKTPRTKKPTRRADPRTLRRFVEELSWLLTSFEDLDFKALGSLAAESTILKKSSGSVSKNRRTETIMLLGRLPSLFLDEGLFPGNEDIVEFAKHALRIDIPRWHKKSKYELIGHVVCNANLLDNRRLQQLVTAIEGLQDTKSQTRSLVQNQRQLGLSWNEVIQNMLSAY
jgi:hypothetical protein